MTHLICCDIKHLLNIHSDLPARLSELSQEVGDELYLVGGSVRDAKLGRQIYDMDLTLKGNGLQLGKILAARLRCPFVPLDDIDKTGRIILPKGYTIDITSFKGKSLKEDLRYRDFTINAMAIRLKDILANKASIIDPLGGIEDLASLRLKAISKQCFEEDPLRVLRAYRLAGQYNLEITDQTKTWIRNARSLLAHIPGERLRYELRMTLATRKPSKQITAMIESGIVSALFPNWNGSINLDLIQILERTDQLISRHVLIEDYGLYPKLTEYTRTIAGDHSGIWLIRLASLILYSTRIENPDKKMNLVKFSAERLKLSNAEKQVYYRSSSGANMLLDQVLSGSQSDNTLFQVLQTAEQETPAVALLVLAHGLVKGSPKFIGQRVNRLLHLFSRHVIVNNTGLLLNGQDIMADLKLPEGPEIGRYLYMLESLQILNDIRTKQEARSLLYDDHLKFNSSPDQK